MTALQVSAKKRLREHIEKIERLQTEMKALADDVRDIYAEAKSEGFDQKIMRKLIAIRKKSKAEWQEEEEILAVYMDALGLGDTPLGDYAARQRLLENAEA